MNVSGSTILITGASSGLGAAAARYFSERGAKLLLVDRDQENGQQLAGQLKGSTFVSADVTDAASTQQAIDTAIATYGSLHAVVQCAGILGAARVVGKDGPHDLNLFARVVQVNLVGTFNVARLAAVAMTRNEPNQHGERGVIVNTSSVAAFDGQLGQSAYAASKGGVASLSLPMARELARFGIRVVAIAPGVFDTPMMSALSDEARAALTEQVPFPPRLGDPAEYASLAAEIIENPMLNGTVIRLDGALRMSAR